MFPASRPLRTVPARSAADCMCHRGGPCNSYDPGHGLHLIQTRLASATPLSWRDALVVGADPAQQTVTVRDWETGTEAVYFNAAGAADIAEHGAPVAVHARYRVLAVGNARFNVREIG